MLLKRHGLLAGILVVLIILPMLTSSGYYHYLMGLAGVYTILAVSLNLLTGFSGQISLGHGALMAVGAYSSALLSTKLDFPIFFSLLAAGLITGLLGLALGFPALRLEGHFLALATTGLAVAVPALAVKWEFLTNGVNGLHLKQLTLFGYVLDNTEKYYLILLVCILVIWGTVNLLKTKPGRALIALRDSETAAKAMGINITYYKVAAFAISSFIAGLGGGLYAHLIGFISPMDFNFWVSINILLMVIIGGVSSIPGAVLGAVYMTLLPELTTRTKGMGMIITGGIVILMMLFFPKGLIDAYHRTLAVIKGKRTRSPLEEQSVKHRGEVGR